MRFSVKKISFPSLACDLLVTFDTLEQMSFLDDCGKYLFSFLFLGHSPVFCYVGNSKTIFDLKVYSKSSDFAWRFLNIKYFTKIGRKGVLRFHITFLKIERKNLSDIFPKHYRQLHVSIVSLWVF